MAINEQTSEWENGHNMGNARNLWKRRARVPVAKMLATRCEGVRGTFSRRVYRTGSPSGCLVSRRGTLVISVLSYLEIALDDLSNVASQLLPCNSSAAPLVVLGRDPM